MRLAIIAAAAVFLSSCNDDIKQCMEVREVSYFTLDYGKASKKSRQVCVRYASPNAEAKRIFEGEKTQ